MTASDEEDVSFDRHSGDMVDFDVSSINSDTLVVHEAWYPGWRATLDGDEVGIDNSGDKVSWRIEVPEGGESLVVRFTPMDFRVGLFVSLACALVSLVMLVPGSGGKAG